MSDFMKLTVRIGVVATLLMGSLVLTACRGDSTDDADMSAADADDAECGAAFVDFVTVEQNEPGDYFAVVQGHYPSACDELGTFDQTVEDGAITITMCSTRPPDVACAQQLTPFEEHIPVETAELEPGSYSVQVNDATTDKEGLAATLTIE